MPSPASRIVEDKRSLRARCTASRAALPEAHRRQAAIDVAGRGLAFCSAGLQRPIVSGYAAMEPELDVFPLLERLARDGFRLCLPVITPLGSPLRFRGWSPGEPLVPRKWGIREPADTAAAVEPDILLVPLLAFDRGGWRLGYGGGYYDRTIARLHGIKPVVAVGIAYDEQEIDAVPREPHDQRLDWVLTPAGPRAPFPAPAG